MKEAGIASIAWMVIMGDGMHNFSDGLAIGETRGRVRAQKETLGPAPPARDDIVVEGGTTSAPASDFALLSLQAPPSVQT